MQLGLKKGLSLFFTFFLAWTALRFLFPLIAPFLFGGLLALAAEPAVRVLTGRLRLNRHLGAGIGVSLVFLILFTLFLTLCAAAVRELGKLSVYLPEIAETAHNGIWLVHNWLLQLSRKMPRSIQPILAETIHAMFSGGTALLEQTVRYILGFAGNLLGRLPDSALAVSTAILSAFMISAKLPELRQALMKRLSQERLHTMVSAWRRIRRAVSGWFSAQFKLMGVTFALLFLGFLLLRIPRPLLWAGVVALVDAFPILGTGTVLLPWSLILLLQGNAAQAVGLAGVYATISLVRSTLEPRLVGRHLGLDPLVTLVALYAGFRLWGIGGMLLAPLLTVAAFQAFPHPEP